MHAGFYMHRTPIVLLNNFLELISTPWTLYSVSGPVLDAPEDHSRKVEDDTVILSNVQTGSSAVYQCNASNEFGYLMANAFVSVLGELAV